MIWKAGFVVAALGWFGTTLEARRRWREDRKALEAARFGLAVGYGAIDPWDHPADHRAIVRSSLLVGAALEARGER